MGLGYFIASVCAVWIGIIGYIVLITKKTKDDKEI